MKDIASIIQQRLRLQTNQAILHRDFNINNPQSVLTNSNIINEFKNWSADKQNKFIIVLGGKVNFKHTKDYLNNL